MPRLSPSGRLPVLLCLLIPATLHADPVLEALAQVDPELVVVENAAAPMPGMREVVTSQGVFYVSEDGRFLMQGTLYDTRDGRNLTQEAAVGNLGALARTLPGRVRFGPDDARDTIYVFTDITCGYCVRLHQQVPALNANGVAVEYLAWPLSGLQGDTFRAMRGIWCAANPAEAYDRAMAGRRPRPGNCEDPIAQHYAFGQAVGVRGTPAIFSADGRRLRGSGSAEALLEALDR
ncbi:MAG: DsbC family protein [Lysobacteraceae bacterium]